MYDATTMNDASKRNDLSQHINKKKKSKKDGEGFVFGFLIILKNLLSEVSTGRFHLEVASNVFFGGSASLMPLRNHTPLDWR